MGEGGFMMAQRRPTHSQRLRALLADGLWHSSAALVRAGCGFRYGSVVERVRKGRDGEPPLAIEARQVSASRWEYRRRPAAP